jgi:hypothetical protein
MAVWLMLPAGAKSLRETWQHKLQYTNWSASATDVEIAA